MSLIGYKPGEKAKCKTCSGIYMPIQLDGMRYFHTCPPIPDKKDAQGNVLTWKNMPDYRDENIKNTTLIAGQKAQIKVEGKGTEPVIAAL